MNRINWRDDTGAATAWMLLLLPVMLAAIGLVLDGGLAVRDWNTAHAEATAAARAGAQQLDLTAYRAGAPLRLNQAAARQAAQSYLADDHVDGTVTATVTSVTVTVTHHTSTQLIGLIGVSTMTEHATAVASPIHGVTGPAG